MDLWGSTEHLSCELQPWQQLSLYLFILVRKEGKVKVTESDACLRMTDHSVVKIGEDSCGTVGPICLCGTDHMRTYGKKNG